MTERPILFQGPMVRPIRAGTKTQTRRICRLQADADHREGGAMWTHAQQLDRCPYGRPGDRLWVRESHWFAKDEHDPVTGYFPPPKTVEDVIYRADGEVPGKVWRPSIHMPRWACRIVLEVTDLRIERLQDISEADARAEGYVLGAPPCSDDPRGWYRHLWESINGAGSWARNPWVWAVSFRLLPAPEAHP